MSLPTFPIFVGCGRSGTTLFGLIFNSHPQLAVAHEAHFVAALAVQQPQLIRPGEFDHALFLERLSANSNFRRFGISSADIEKQLQVNEVTDYPGAVRSVFEVFARLEGKILYGDKTPGYVSHLGLLGGLFPEARFVHIIRDGRDVALAYLDRPEWGPRTTAEAAFYWKSRVQKGRAASARLGPNRYHEVRYESLIEDPERTVRETCKFLDLDFVPEMLRYHERGVPFAPLTKDPQAFESSATPLRKGLRDWRTQMPAADLALFEAIAGSVLDDLGYELSGQRIGLATRARVGLALIRWQLRRFSSRARPR